MTYIPNLRKKYREEIIPALTKEFSYHSVMQVPKLEKIVINQGVGAGCDLIRKLWILPLRNSP